MSVDATAPTSATTPPQPPAPPEFPTLLGHPRPLWMLFMTEFWERFAFYGIRWALVLYIVAQFFNGDATGQAPAGRTYGAYLALVYAAAIFGGYVADRVLGYQRSILVGAAVMATGLFLIAIPDHTMFEIGLATVVVGNGLFKPNISTMVGKLYSVADPRRDSGFTIFYMGINLGAMISPVLTQLLAEKVFGTQAMPSYKMVFMASGVGMLISLVWFWIGRAQLKGIGAPAPNAQGIGRVLMVLVGCVLAVPVVYFLLAVGADVLQIVLTVLFVGLSVMLLVEGIREGKVQRDKVIAMLIIFAFNVLFWMFFEQAGSSFTFLADNIVDRGFGDWTFPTAWFQSVNSIAIITLAPIIAWIWVKSGRFNPSIPRKFGLGLLFNGLAFLLLMFALSSLVNDAGKVPFWTLFMVYVIQSVGELCLSPIGLSMVTKLAPVRLVGFGMGGWFLSTGIGNNLSGIFAGHVSGSEGMSVSSALSGYTFGFWALLGAGAVLFLIAPLINKLMHGVK
ncbi:peptide MFS transporter [Xanthomonas hortorum]|uniref:Oligopeptide:H+ symporter n=3 Tax=Xanthomonas hortorum TaxID=56454 RepID=A0AA47IAG1_9XANT|nr:oligopeptide:H+ symporter [Xanthomonas hortorum]MCE4355146.1 oligopeptide:H+ symporter [Xanthomonas hortorum pv. pelargonii]MCM5523351.1 oligopeptide:H+ symporter [Xanthomonas hortorum pv. pelargonii]MCM5535987.1 oligopeptide:H+ symporter [Xanthomonas hortorum pv. pelargonii]MCM5539988.1 oligopeptide:H+ symporter [Xanthomonas hortorum pv. pelargonii]MCM5544948.1 oligopeptide:H+ symporter [Xanthomonas hortorum pv. pelargonii]